MVSQIRSKSRRTRQKSYFEALEARVLLSTTLADWTFETSLPATAGPFIAELGTQGLTANGGSNSAVATGSHAGTATYSTPAGNGSAHCFSSNTWAVGDYYQFQVSTLTGAAIALSFDQTSSGTGPKDFTLQYSTDGTNFTTFNGNISGNSTIFNGVYNVLANASPNPTWNGTTPSAIYTFTADLSGITAIENKANVYFRLVDNDTTSANGGTVATGGTDRIDNFTVVSNAVAVTSYQALGFNPASYSVNEAAGTVTLTVSRLPANGTDLTGTETVHWTTSNGTALAGTNFGASGNTAQLSGDLTFAPGVTSQTLNVPILNFHPQNGDKNFTVTLSNPQLTGQTAGVGVSLAQATAQVTVQDDSENFALSSGSYSVNEAVGDQAALPAADQGPAGAAAIFSVTRTGYSADAATVNFATGGGTATNGVNYTATSGTINFVAGQTVATFAVPVLDAGNMGGNKTFTLTLSSPVTTDDPAAAALGLTSATVNIIDKTPLTNNLTSTSATVSAIETSGYYGNSYAPLVGSTTAGTGSFSFLAFEVLDFSPSTTPSIYPGLGYTVDSLNNLSLQLFNTDNTAGSNYNGHPGNFNVYFIPSDTPATTSLKFMTADVNGLNGQAGTGPDTLLGTFSFNDTYGYDTYTAASIPAAVATQLVNDLNSGIAFRLAITPQTTGIAADWAKTGNPPTLSLSVTQHQAVAAETLALNTSYTVNENAGTATITVTRTGTNTSDTASVQYFTTDGTALNGTNYSSANSNSGTAGTLNFAAGVTTASFTVPITDVLNMGGNKAFIVNLFNPTVGANLVALGQASALVTIVDAHATSGTETLTQTSAGQFNIESTGNYTQANGYFEVAGSSQAYPDYGVLDFNSYNETTGTPYLFTPSATVGAINSMTLYVYSAGTNAAGPLNIYLVSDSTRDPLYDNTLIFDTTALPEGLNVQLGTASLMGTAMWSGTVTPNSLVAMTLSNYDQATENTLIADLNTGAKFRLVITPESAGVHADMQGQPAGTNPGFISPYLSFNVTSAAQLAFSSATCSTNQALGTATITVNRSQSSAGPVSVHYATSNGSAVAGTDYTATSGTLNFTDGQTSASFTIPLTNTGAGPDKTVNLTLSSAGPTTPDSPVTYAVLGAQTTAVLTISHAAILIGDADGNGVVNGADFDILSANWGKSNVGFNGGDFNGDGTVDFADFAILSNNMVATLPASDPATAPPTVETSPTGPSSSADAPIDPAPVAGKPAPAATIAPSTPAPSSAHGPAIRTLAVSSSQPFQNLASNDTAPELQPRKSAGPAFIIIPTSTGQTGTHRDAAVPGNSASNGWHFSPGHAAKTPGLVFGDLLEVEMTL